LTFDGAEGHENSKFRPRQFAPGGFGITILVAFWIVSRQTEDLESIEYIIETRFSLLESLFDRTGSGNDDETP
jgi:hypothetical protein